MAENARILVVEDDAFIALDVTQALRDFGYEVIAAVASGKEALEIALSSSPDLILMDISIQGDMDGIQVAEEIHKHTPVPLVFLTALADEATLQRARVVGPYGYLIKPFDPAELRSTIEVAMDRCSAAPQSGIVEDKEGLEDLVLALGVASSAEEKATLLKSIGFFETLPPDQLRSLAACGEVVTVAGGEFVHLEEARPKRAFIVLTGRVSVKKTTSTGKELIIALLGAGDCFGMLPMLPAYAIEAGARAQLESKILAFPRPLFKRLLQEAPEINVLLTAELARRLAVSYDLAISLAHSRVEARILGTLNTLLETMARGTANAKGEMRLFITRKELADLTGTTPETAIRVTKQLERDGVLDLSRPGVIKVPSIPRLRELL